MNNTIELDEVLADVFAYMTAAGLENTENPSMEAVELAHSILAYQGIDEGSLEFSMILSTIYSLSMMGYLNVTLEI